MTEDKNTYKHKNKIFVKNYITESLIGIYPEEKRNKQKIKISIILDVINQNFNDNIDKVVSYELILSKLKEIKNLEHINLLETLAKNLCEEFKQFKNVKKIKISIEKIEILKGNGTVGIKLINYT